MSTATAVGEAAISIAKEFAEVYARGDFERVRELVSPDVLEREINPGGYVEFKGPDELIEEAREFTDKYGYPEVLELTVEAAGPLVRVINRWRHRPGDESLLCDFYELLRIEDGLVTQIDLVCSGTVPER